MPEIMLNGKHEAFAAGTTIADILREKKINPAIVVVERNERIIDKSAYHTPICPHDTIEIVQFMGGG